MADPNWTTLYEFFKTVANIKLTRGKAAWTATWRLDDATVLANPHRGHVATLVNHAIGKVWTLGLPVERARCKPLHHKHAHVWGGVFCIYFSYGFQMELIQPVLVFLVDFRGHLGIVKKLWIKKSCRMKSSFTSTNPFVICTF